MLKNDKNSDENKRKKKKGSKKNWTNNEDDGKATKVPRGPHKSVFAGSYSMCLHFEKSIMQSASARLVSRIVTRSTCLALGLGIVAWHCGLALGLGTRAWHWGLALGLGTGAWQHVNCMTSISNSRT